MSQVLDLPELVRGLPPEPPAELGSALDAASRCFARHGITRTSMNDIGREAGVSRSTIYRQLGTVDHAARLLLAREVHQLFSDHLIGVVAAARGPEVVVTVLEAIITHAREHPVLRKVLADEPEIIGPFLVTDLPDATRQVAEMASPILAAAMGAGLIRRQDPLALAHWLVRVAVVMIIDPPPQPVHDFLMSNLLPALDPDGDRP